jgi:hypothetical protein
MPVPAHDAVYGLMIPSASVAYWVLLKPNLTKNALRRHLERSTEPLSALISFASVLSNFMHKSICDADLFAYR